MSSYPARCSHCGKSMRVRGLFTIPICGACQTKEKKRIALEMDRDVLLWAMACLPDVNDLHSVLDGPVRFCKVHGIVNHDGFASLRKSSCSCASSSAPSKTIRQANIHFAIRHKSKGWIRGCTIAPSATEIEQMRADGEKVNVTNHLSHVSCRQCATRIRRVLAEQDE